MQRFSAWVCSNGPVVCSSCVFLMCVDDAEIVSLLYVYMYNIYEPEARAVMLWGA